MSLMRSIPGADTLYPIDHVPSRLGCLVMLTIFDVTAGPASQLSAPIYEEHLP